MTEPGPYVHISSVAKVGGLTVFAMSGFGLAGDFAGVMLIHPLIAVVLMIFGACFWLMGIVSTPKPDPTQKAG